LVGRVRSICLVEWDISVNGLNEGLCHAGEAGTANLQR
jgi:hypothetical protein